MHCSFKHKVIPVLQRDYYKTRSKQRLRQAITHDEYAYYKDWTYERMSRAMYAVMDGRMSISCASINTLYQSLPLGTELVVAQFMELQVGNHDI